MRPDVELARFAAARWPAHALADAGRAARPARRLRAAADALGYALATTIFVWLTAWLLGSRQARRATPSSGSCSASSPATRSRTGSTCSCRPGRGACERRGARARRQPARRLRRRADAQQPAAGRGRRHARDARRRAARHRAGADHRAAAADHVQLRRPASAPSSSSPASTRAACTAARRPRSCSTRRASRRRSRPRSRASRWPAAAAPARRWRPRRSARSWPARSGSSLLTLLAEPVADLAVQLPRRGLLRAHAARVRVGDRADVALADPRLHRAVRRPADRLRRHRPADRPVAADLRRRPARQRDRHRDRRRRPVRGRRGAAHGVAAAHRRATTRSSCSRQDDSRARAAG